MTKLEALKKIKALRDEINDKGVDAVTDAAEPTTNVWINEVLFHLDAASDAAEFPRG